MSIDFLPFDPIYFIKELRNDFADHVHYNESGEWKFKKQVPPRNNYTYYDYTAETNYEYPSTNLKLKFSEVCL